MGLRVAVCVVAVCCCVGSPAALASTSVPVGAVPQDVVVDSAADVAFVAASHSNEIDVVDLAHGTTLATVSTGVGFSPIALALDAADHRLFVTDGGAVRTYDTTTDTQTASLDVVSTAVAFIVHLAYDPASGLLLTAADGYGGGVAAIDPDANAVVRSFFLQGSSAVAVDAERNRAVVAVSSLTGGPESEATIDLADGTVTTAYPPASAHWGNEGSAAVDPLLGTALLTGPSSTFYVDTAAQAFFPEHVDYGFDTAGAAVDPAHGRALVIDGTGGALRVLNLATRTETASLPLPGGGMAVAYDPAEDAAVVVAPTGGGTGPGTLTVLPLPSATPVAGAVVPSSSSLPVGKTRGFSAIFGTAGASTWSVDGIPGGNATVGTIDASGRYAAPAAVPSPATVTIGATDPANPASIATAALTIVPPPAVGVTLSAARTTIPETQSTSLTVDVAGVFDTRAGLTVNGVADGNATVGTVATDAYGAITYTAPLVAPASPVTITATSLADPSASASVTVTITALPRLARIVLPSDGEELAVDAGAGRAYVSSYGSDSYTVLDLATRAVAATVSVAPLRPTAVAVDPATHRVYLVGQIEGSTQMEVAVYDSSGTPLATIALPGTQLASGVAVDQQLGELAVTTWGGLYTVDLATEAVTQTLSGPFVRVAVDPVRHLALVGMHSPGAQVTVVDLTGAASPYTIGGSGSSYVSDLAVDSRLGVAVETYSAGFVGGAAAASETSGAAWWFDYGNLSQGAGADALHDRGLVLVDDTMHVVDLTNGAETAALALEPGAKRVAYDPTDNTAIVLVTATGTVSIVPLPAGSVPPLVTVGPPATIDQRTTFAATGSFADSDSTSWTATVDYGDGAGPGPLVLSGTTFSLSHAYDTAGTFTVTVCVTDDSGRSGCGTATVTVQRVNLPPVCQTITFTELAGRLIDGALPCFDPDGSRRLVQPALLPDSRLADRLRRLVPVHAGARLRRRRLFSVQATDNDGATSAPATVTLAYLTPNSPPSANDGTATTLEDQPVTIRPRLARLGRGDGHRRPGVHDRLRPGERLAQRHRPERRLHARAERKRRRQLHLPGHRPRLARRLLDHRPGVLAAAHESCRHRHDRRHPCERPADDHRARGRHRAVRRPGVRAGFRGGRGQRTVPAGVRRDRPARRGVARRQPRRDGGRHRYRARARRLVSCDDQRLRRRALDVRAPRSPGDAGGRDRGVHRRHERQRDEPGDALGPRHAGRRRLAGRPDERGRRVPPLLERQCDLGPGCGGRAGCARGRRDGERDHDAHGRHVAGRRALRPGERVLRRTRRGLHVRRDRRRGRTHRGCGSRAGRAESRPVRARGPAAGRRHGAEGDVPAHPRRLRRPDGCARRLVAVGLAVVRGLSRGLRDVHRLGRCDRERRGAGAPAPDRWDVLVPARHRRRGTGPSPRHVRPHGDRA